MKTIEKFLEEYKNISKILLTFIALIGFYIAFNNYINSQIENKITDTKYIQNLSSTLRPFIIFNEDGIITYNHGGEKYIDSIKIEYSKNLGKAWPNSIKVYSNQFLSNSPLLDYIGVYNFTYDVERTKNNTWTFKVKPVVVNWTPTEKIPMKEEPSGNIYILEVLL